MSTHNICFYEEIRKKYPIIITEYSSLTILVEHPGKSGKIKKTKKHKQTTSYFLSKLIGDQISVQNSGKAPIHREISGVKIMRKVTRCAFDWFEYANCICHHKIGSSVPPSKTSVWSRFVDERYLNMLIIYCRDDSRNFKSLSTSLVP